jgi:hypothetical protein
MPDISMCRNNSCLLRSGCYRYRAKPDPYRQAVANFGPGGDEDVCSHFWPIVEREAVGLLTMEEIESHAEDDE